MVGKWGGFRGKDMGKRRILEESFIIGVGTRVKERKGISGEGMERGGIMDFRQFLGG